MDAGTIFNDLIEKIENSKLNYVINKTPFSANISIKRSLIKYFDTAPETILKLDKSDMENTELKEKLVAAEQQNKKLDNLIKEEKTKVKSLEDQIGQFREELLNIKSEKNVSNSAFKRQKIELNGLKQELNKINQVKKDIEDELKAKSKGFESKDVECKHLTNEKKELQKKFDKKLSELDVMKNERLLENNNKVNFKCSFCDDKYECAVELSQHVRRNHYKDQISQTRQAFANIFTQTEEKSETITCEYPCFYCGNIICSSEDLQKHKLECHEASLPFQDDC